MSDDDGDERELMQRSAARQVLTRAGLAGSLYREIGLSHHEAASLVAAVLEEISAALIRGGTVKLSSFGTFSVKQKKLRMGRNPKTGKEVPILPRKVLVFRASHILKDRCSPPTLAAWGIPNKGNP
jgi:integration host factor subunit alpha